MELLHRELLVVGDLLGRAPSLVQCGRLGRGVGSRDREGVQSRILVHGPRRPELPLCRNVHRAVLLFLARMLLEPTLETMRLHSSTFRW